MKRILLATLLLFAVAQVFAQRFDAGLIAGLNASQLEGDAYSGFHKAGLVAGIFVQTDIAPAIITGMEIKYSQQGMRKKYDPKQPEIDKYIMRLGYIDIPLFVGFRTSQKSMIIGGISPGVLLHEREYNSDGELPEEERQTFNTFDLQALAGFRFDFLEKTSVDLRFALSLVPCVDQEGTNYYYHNGLFNTVITLALYYQL